MLLGALIIQHPNTPIVMQACETTTKPSTKARKRVKHLRGIIDQDRETKMALLRRSGSIEELLAKLVMEEEVESLCGKPYARDDVHGGRYERWGTNPGSIRIMGKRLKIRVQRVRDKKEGKERPLETYCELRNASVEEENNLTENILLGMSQRDYHRVVSAFADSYGLSASSVSRTFKKKSAEALKKFEERDLSSETYVTLLIDGKYLQECQIVLCMGITADGKKEILGMVETTTENAEAITGLLEGLINRGLCYDQDLLCVVDGAKGLYKAVKDVFGDYTQVQRCTWHKRENVVSKLTKKEDAPKVRRKMQEAYREDTYDDAKAGLETLRDDLEEQGEEAAARSLEEGMEETLTLHRLGVADTVGCSLLTTNIIENVNGQLANRTRRIRRWVNSDQRHRWVAMAMLETEPRLCKLSCAKHLPKLQKALLKCVPKPYLGPTPKPVLKK